MDHQTTQAPIAAEEIKHLIATLQGEHQKLQSRLSEYQSRVWLSDAEVVERKQLQKLKLLKKDQIARLEAQLRMAT